MNTGLCHLKQSKKRREELAALSVGSRDNLIPQV